MTEVNIVRPTLKILRAEAKRVFGQSSVYVGTNYGGRIFVSITKFRRFSCRYTEYHKFLSHDRWSAMVRALNWLRDQPDLKS